MSSSGDTSVCQRSVSPRAPAPCSSGRSDCNASPPPSSSSSCYLLRGPASMYRTNQPLLCFPLAILRTAELPGQSQSTAGRQFRMYFCIWPVGCCLLHVHVCELEPLEHQLKRHSNNSKADHALSPKRATKSPISATNQGSRKKWSGVFCCPFWGEGMR
jgi:hypothetical protein